MQFIKNEKLNDNYNVFYGTSSTILFSLSSNDFASHFVKKIVALGIVTTSNHILSLPVPLYSSLRLYPFPW